MRFVLDTNTLVSGLLWGGTPGQLIAEIIARNSVLLTTDSLLDELQEVLGRPKFAPRFTAKGFTPQEVLEQYQLWSVIVTPSPIPHGVIRDKDDEAILSCAVGGRADYIVSGDGDLLTLKEYQNIPIITTSQCLAILSE
jgi:uncharacterized protein